MKPEFTNRFRIPRPHLSRILFVWLFIFSLTWSGLALIRTGRDFTGSIVQRTFVTASLWSGFTTTIDSVVNAVDWYITSFRGAVTIGVDSFVTAVQNIATAVGNSLDISQEVTVPFKGFQEPYFAFPSSSPSGTSPISVANGPTQAQLFLAVQAYFQQGLSPELIMLLKGPKGDIGPAGPRGLTTSIVNNGGGGSTTIPDDLSLQTLIVAGAITQSSANASNSFVGSLDVTKGLRASNFTQVGNQTSYFNGNVGIGTTAPAAKLEIAADTDVATIGSEMVTNGSFTGNATDWTLGLGGGTPDWFYNTNKVSHANGGGTATLEPNPALSVVAGATYLVSFDLTGYSSGSMTVSIGGTSGLAVSYNVTSFVQILAAVNTTNLKLTPTTNFVGNIDNVSVKLVTTITPAFTIKNNGGTDNINIEVRSGGNLLYNTYIGYQSGFANTTGNQNSALGALALQSNTTGRFNTATGVAALRNNTTGQQNTATGLSSLGNNTTGIDNTANGTFSMQNNTTGQENTAFGWDSSLNNTTGSQNTAVGASAGRSLNGGSFNTFLGYNAGFTALQLITAQNSMALGNGTYTTASNQVVIGNTAVTRTLLNGNVGIGTVSPDASLEIASASAARFIIRSNGSTASSSIDFLPAGGSSISNQNKFTIRAGGSSGTGGERLEILNGAAIPLSLMTIASNGNVGIGTTNIDAKFELAGTGITTGSVASISASALTTGNALRIEANALTTGFGINLRSTGTVITPGAMLNIMNNTMTTGAVASISGTGVTSGNLLKLTGGVTTGSGILANVNNLTTGFGINLRSTGAITTGGAMLNIMNNTMTTGSIASISATALAGGSVFNITVPASTSANNPAGIMLVKNVNNVTVVSLSMGGTLALRGRIYTHAGGQAACVAVNNPSSGCLDYAESYPSVDGLNPGDVVAWDNAIGRVRRAIATDTVIGVISSNPAVLVTGTEVRTGAAANEQIPGKASVALVGHVPVKVSLENGPILAGDHVAPSLTKPGYAVKAVNAGMTIGTALSGIEDGTVSGAALVDVFVNLSYWIPDDAIASLTSGIQVGTDSEGNLLINRTGVASTTTLVKFDDQGDAVFTGSITAARIGGQLEGLAPVLSQIAALSTRVERLETSSAPVAVPVALLDMPQIIASMSARLALQLASQSARIDVLTELVDSLQKSLDLAALASQSRALTFNGVVTVAGGLRVDTIRSTDDAINLMNDAVFFGRPYFNADTAGFAVVPKGEREVQIVFDDEYLDEPVVHTALSLGDEADALIEAQTFDENVRHLISRKNAKGFTIVLERPAPRDMRFNWIALAVKNPKTFVPVPLSVPDLQVMMPPPTAEPTPTDTPTPSPSQSEPLVLEPSPSITPLDDSTP